MAASLPRPDPAPPVPLGAWRAGGAIPLPAPPSSAQRRPAHRAEDLCGPAGLASIVLGDQVYTLRITRAGKLILTK